MDELIVVCLVRNGELYMKSFSEHYFSLGVKHIIFLDNNSTDETVSLARDYENVTVLRTKLPFKKYEHLMRQYLIARFARGRWCLYADIDELFDYPFSDVVSLSSLIKYLSTKSYTAVVTQVLDMFSDKPVLSRKSTIGDSLKDLYRFYDISDIRKKDYRIAQNIVSNSEIKIYFGGIRKTLFGVNDIMLTNHRMLFIDDEIIPMPDSSHSLLNARIADFSCVLLHYKFLSNFYEYTADAVRGEYHYNGSAEYKQYFKILKKNPNLHIKQETSRELKSVNELINNGFLVVSEDYVNWAEAVPDGS